MDKDAALWMGMAHALGTPSSRPETYVGDQPRKGYGSAVSSGPTKPKFNRNKQRKKGKQQRKARKQQRK